MEEIANLSRIVTSRRLSSFPLLDLSDGNPNKETQLVMALVSSPELTQHQLVRNIYGQASPTNIKAFRKLRSRVQTKLLNHLYFLDHSDARHIVSRRYEMEVLDLFHQLSALYAEGEYVLAERLLRKCLRLAQDGEFTQYVVLAARLLRNMYASQQLGTKHRNIAKILAKAQKQLVCEDEAERIFMEVRLALTGTVATRRGLTPKLPAFIKQVEELHRNAGTYGTYHHLYRLQLIKEELRGNYAAIIPITAEAERLLKKGKLNAKRFDTRFNQFETVYAYLRSRQPAAGLKLAELYTRDFHPSSNNWFFFQEHHLLLALHAGEYDHAHQVLQLVKENPFYPKQRAAAQQRWDLFRAYVAFLRPPQRPTLQQRQAAQWALMLPDFSRDKRGNNVAILVLQVLHYLRLRDLDAVLIRLERLRKYQQRHLRDADTLRSQLFMRLLQITPEKEFDPVACAERGKNLLNKLQAAPQPGEAYAEIEVVPYENLWALILEILRDGPPESALPGVLPKPK